MNLNFDERFDNLHNEKINDTNECLKDYFDDDTILFNIQENREFFRDIPYKDLDDVLNDFIHLIFDLSSTKNQINFNQCITNYKNKKKPSSQIKDDLALLKKCNSMIINKFGTIKNNDTTNYIIMGNTPNEIKELIKTNNLLIKDLEKKEFNLINKNKYYSNLQLNKNKLKLFLKDIRLKYKLKSVTKIEKRLIDSLFN